MIRIGPMLAGASFQVRTERRLEFEALPEGWWAVAAALFVGALCWIVVLLYRREGRGGAVLRLRMVMAAIRCAVLLLLVAIWLEPVMATYLTRWTESHTLILLDDSASMDLRDPYRDPALARRVTSVLGEPADEPIRRADLAERILQRDDARLLAALASRNAVKVYAFSDGLELLETVAADRPNQPAPASDSDSQIADRTTEALHLTAQGPATNAGQAIHRAVQQQGGAPIAGIIMLTDGSFTQPGSAESIADLLGEQQIPLHLIGIGDPAPPRNVRVVQLTAPHNAFEGDPFELTAHLSATGMVGQSIELRLFERPVDGTGDPQLVGQQTITIQTDGPLPPQVFERRRDTIGRWAYHVEVPPAPYESITDDNRKQITVNVIDSRARILLVAGNASWDYRYLSRLLERDDAFDVSCWLQTADPRAARDGNTIIDRLPSTPESLLAYDAVILLDPDPDELSRSWCELVSRLVSQHGGGLLYAAARIHTPGLVHDPRLGPLVKLWPVTVDPEADLILNRIGHYQRQAFEVTVPDDALGHPVMRQHDDSAANRLDWQGIGDIYWHYPVLRQKPVANVLLRHGDARMANAYGAHVLAATQFVGAGRTAFLAFDGSWRWRRYGEDFFNGFWIRLIRYLVEGKLLGTNNRGQILTDADTYQLGDTVSITARLYDPQFNPLQASEVSLSVSGGALQHKLLLQPVADQPGLFSGRFVPDRTGSYELELEIPTPGRARPVVIRRGIGVARPNIEMANPRMNRAALVSLASSGPDGHYHEMDEFDDLAESIVDRHESTTIRARPTPLWDSIWMLTLLIALLAGEWTLRKVYRLL
ncbi:MAG: hypothetical protein ACE5GE_03475 [Phycisphaerae bacterium]